MHKKKKSYNDMYGTVSMLSTASKTYFSKTKTRGVTLKAPKTKVGLLTANKKKKREILVQIEIT